MLLRCIALGGCELSHTYNNATTMCLFCRYSRSRLLIALLYLVYNVIRNIFVSSHPDFILEFETFYWETMYSVYVAKIRQRHMVWKEECQIIHHDTYLKMSTSSIWHMKESIFYYAWFVWRVKEIFETRMPWKGS